MKHLTLYIFLVLFVFTYSQTPIKSRKFQWQIHSFNDHREITQLIRKGTTLFKIDLYYVPQSQCYTSDTRANTDPRGCFLLTHDKPVPSIDYDTVYQYLDEILNHKSHFSNPSLKSDLALCFKETPGDICTSDVNQWMPLVDDLYTYIDNFIQSNSLNIQIVYDGKKSQCVLPKWNNWIYTWIRGRDPDDAFYNDDADLYYNKFAIFNNKDIRLEEDALKDWGKFKNYDRPLQMWEPNHQEDMLYFGKIFLDHPHKAGYAYAINVDTSMYQVYTAFVSGENLNWNLIEDKNVSMKRNVFKIINGKYIYFFRGNENKIDFYTFEQHGNKMALLKSVNNVQMPSNNFKDIIQLNENVFIIHDIIGEYCLYEIDNVEMLIKNTKCSKFDIITDNSKNNEMKFTNTDNRILNEITTIPSSLTLIKTNTIMLVYSYENNQINTAIFTLNTDTLTLVPTFSKQNILSTENSIEYMENKCTSKNCLLLIKEMNKNNIISHLYSYNVDTHEITFISSPYKDFGVGEHFSLSIREENENVDKFILVKDNAYPYHSEEQNKDAYIKLCDQPEKLTPHVLNYIYGDISKESIENENNYSSVCNHDVISGTYDMGDYPRVEFYKKEDGKYGFIEMHDGINDDMLGLNIIVGLSRFYDGIVVDNWDVGDVAVKREVIKKK